jgi:hypothetical protein
MGGLLGGQSPQSKRWGIYKAKPYFQGGWEKYRKINSFRIIRQRISDLLSSFKIYDL